jgi:DnaJ-like protein
MSYTSWIDQQILDAEKRGVFDNLPGAGKPLDLKPEGDADYGQAWMRDYARREGVRPEEFLPTPLRLRKEIERLAETVGDMDSEHEVRETVGELNRRILEWRRIPVGPPVFVRLVDSGEMVERWRQAQAGKRPRSQAGSAVSTSAGTSQGTRPIRRGWRWLLPFLAALADLNRGEREVLLLVVSAPAAVSHTHGGIQRRRRP